jgi:glycosyltransferase involved in cell wall biosynthesis
MKIGICSPFMPQDLADLLDSDSSAMLVKVKGVTATPVTPLARAWHQQGHTIAVFCLDPSAAEPLHLTGERLSIDVLPKRRFRHSMVDVYREERRRIREAVALEEPDVLSAQWSYEHALGALDTGIPTVVTCHDTPLRYAWISKSFFMTYHLFVAASVIRRARRIVCVSPYTAEHVRKLFRPKCVPQVIPNGISKEISRRGRRRLASNGRKSGTFTICSIGGWGGIKNIKTLLKAYSHAQSPRESTRLVLFGNGLGTGGEAEQWAKARHLAEGVEFRGSTPRESILEFLEADADLVVHPSLVETHGMVLIEAMACGVPVIGGRSSGAVPWTLGQGEFGFLCDVRSTENLANTMVSAMRDREGTSAMVRRAWDSVVERFNMETTARENLSVLEEMVSESNRRMIP